MSSDVQVRRGDGFVVTAPLISLREWYAGLALQGLLASWRSGPALIRGDEMADYAFQMADAMLAEAAKEGR